MADKVFTATDLKLSRMVCASSGDIHDSLGTAIVSIECPYQFLDSGDSVISQLGKGILTIQDEIGNLPANIQTALQDLDIYIKAQAMSQEGM